MQTRPIAEMMAWPAPNFIDPETRGHGVLILNVVLFSVALCLAGLRIFTRTILRGGYGADDTFILIALVCILDFNQRHSC